MAFTQKAHDTFTGTINDPLDTHTPDQGSAWADAADNFSLTATNSLQCSAAGDVGTRNTTTLASIQAAELVHNAGGGGITAIFLRMAGEGAAANITGYLIHARGTIFNDCQIYRVDNGSYTLIGSGVVGIADGEVNRGEAIGSALELFINGVSRATATDSTYTTGSAGIRSGTGPNFVVGDTFKAFDDAGVGPRRFLLAG